MIPTRPVPGSSKDFKSENWPSEVEFASDFEGDNVDDSAIGAAPTAEKHKPRNSSGDSRESFQATITVRLTLCTPPPPPLTDRK